MTAISTLLTVASAGTSFGSFGTNLFILLNT